MGKYSDQYDANRINSIKMIDEAICLSGKTVLDLGCGYDGFMVKNVAAIYGDSFIYGIDPAAEKEDGENYRIQKGDARTLEFEDNTFDAIYTISTFEHIKGTDKALAEIRRVLKPYGKAYIAFAPVWTSVCGHHSYNMMNAFTDDGIKNGDLTDEHITYAIPAWGHLYMTQAEMGEHLHKIGFQENKIDALLYDIYRNNFINRERAYDIRSNIMNAGMIVRFYYESITYSREWSLNRKGISELTPEIAKRLTMSGFTPEETGIVYMRAVLEKFSSTLR